MRKIRVHLRNNSYDILIGRGLLTQAASALRELGYSGKLVIITDSTVKSLYGDILKQSLTRNGFKVTVLGIPEGEEQKSLETAAKLYQQLSESRAERTTPILALGGGVIGDLAGFVAATYLRGVPLIQIPTTLLAQVDSSIGGKVAVDHGLLKNQIGAFYQPKLVISDIATLKTLPAGELSDGLAEIIKYGVICDKRFFTYIEKNLDRIKSLDETVIETVVYKSAKIKARVVEEDERDLGLRNILNYGHTVGHAIESVSEFNVRHGEAIAIGMVVAARIANKLGIFSKDELIRLKSLITKAGLPTEVPNFKPEELIRAMGHDKKILQDRLRFVLPKSIGEVIISDDVTPSLIKEILGERNGKI